MRIARGALLVVAQVAASRCDNADKQFDKICTRFDCTVSNDVSVAISPAPRATRHCFSPLVFPGRAKD